ncbi:NAD(P)-binding domain-containing protein [Candidatus Sumerlaeota bacterium]|nr:NAD(P)-binding domain-containing protein [Candidatus Sumerlaeota bacterium]
MQDRILDSVIIGGGPAGIAVAETFSRKGISHRVYEKGPIAHHIAQYPTFMRFFSTNENLEIANFPLANPEDKPTRQDYLIYLNKFAKYHALPIETYVEVTGATKRGDGVFQLDLAHSNARPHDLMVCPPPEPMAAVLARSMVVAVGAWDSPRRLGVPGDDLPKVHYRFFENHEYVGKKVLVVGGRNSAVDLALTLWRAGAQVSLSYRRTEFTGRGLKYWLKPDIENRLKNGEVSGYLGSTVEKIERGSVTLMLASNERVVLENDFVLPCLGYDPPTNFLKNLGISLEPGSNKPVHNPANLESNIPGLFVAGVITQGNISGNVFIENSRHHGDLILPRLREILNRPERDPS